MSDPAVPARRAADAFALDPRIAVLLVSGFASMVLVVGLALLPVPYVVLRPGPVLNTLGSAGGHKLITISGRRSYPPKGTLDLTTVSSLGGPGRGITLPQMVAGWLDDADAVLPQEQVYPKDVTEKQTEQIYREQMVGSQQDATVAALTELGIEVPATLRIAGVSPEVPAASVLRKGDVIVAVAGQGISTYGQLRTALRALPAGQATTITVRRGGERRRLETRTATAPDGRTVLGVVLDPTFTFPFTVRIQIDNIGGPSAGMMFALGIIDNLTPGELTGGRRIAGTGTIDPDGSVGPIDGIRQKMVGARRAGAGWFLAPAGNCPEVLGRVPAGLRVVKVATLHQAHAAVQGIASGGAGLAGC